MKKQPVLVFFTCFISACSTYKTNTSTTFDSIHLSGQEPVIHVGNITEKPDQLTLLGWVDASVTKPNLLAKDPTEQQVDIILAEKGQALGADAIIYVTYKSKIGSSLLTKLEAHGQAVKLKDDNAELQGLPKKVSNTNNIVKIDNTGMQLASPSTPPATPSATTPAGTTTPSHPQTTNEAAFNTHTKDKHSVAIPTTVEEAMNIPTTTPQKSSEAEAVSLKNTVDKKARERAAMPVQIVQCAEPSLNDIAEYESNVEAINYMIMNADFLFKKAREIKNQDMESASSRLNLLLQQQLAQLKAHKPKE